MNPKILVAGYYGYGNLGDEAILSVLLGDLREQFNEPVPIVLSNNPAQTETQHDVTSIHWQDFPRVTAELAVADLLIIGGGGLFHDYWQVAYEELLTEAQQGLSYYASLAVVAQVFHVPHIVYGAGVGPLTTVEGRDLAADVLSTAALVSVRDRGSLAEIEQHGLVPDSGFVRLGSDLAVRWPRVSQGLFDQMKARPRRSRERKVLGVNLRYWDLGVHPEEVEAEVASALDEWLADGGWAVRLIPFQASSSSRYDDDLTSIRRVRERMARRSSVEVITDGTPSKVVPAIGDCDLFLAERYHAILLSILVGTPCALIAYDLKCESLAHELGIADQMLAIGQVGKSEIVNLLRQTHEHGADRTREIERNLASLRKRGRRQSRLIAQATGLNNRTRLMTSRARRLVAQRISQGQMVAAWPFDAEVLQQLPGQLAEAKQAIEALDQENRQLAKDLERSYEKVDRAKSKVEGIKAKLQIFEEQRDGLVADLSNVELELKARQTDLVEKDKLVDRLQSELASIRGTRGFQLLAGYWQVANVLAPVGSRRRGLLKTLKDGWDKIEALLGMGAGLQLHIPSNGHETWEEEVGWREEQSKAYRTFAEQRLHPADRIGLILAPTGFDLAEGQRSVHLARELADRGIPIVFSHWRWERSSKRSAHLPHPGVFQTPIDILLDLPAAFLDPIRSQEKWMIFEFPYPGFFDLLAGAHSEGWITAYDVVDDWEAFHRAGQAPWYEAQFERHLANSVDIVLTSSEELQEKVKVWTGRKAVVIPNGASRDVVFQANAKQTQEGEVTIGYFGSLVEAWFDWGLVTAAAETRPDWRFEIVGPIAKGIPSQLPSNVSLLGQAEQADLAQIAARWQVAIAPFRVGELARAVDPIKTYEYLSLGLPVVVSGVSAPPGSGSHVLRADGACEFLKAVEQQLARGEEGRAARISFGRLNSWAERAATLIKTLESSEDRLAEKRALIPRQ